MITEEQKEEAFEELCEALKKLFLATGVPPDDVEDWVDRALDYIVEGTAKYEKLVGIS